MIDEFVVSYIDVIVYLLPFALVWRLGGLIVTFLLDCITGGRRGKVNF